MIGKPKKPMQGMPEERALRYIDLSRTTFASDAPSLLPEETARRYRAVPIERQGDVTLVAVASPANPLTMEALREGAGGEVSTVVASPDQVTAAIAYLYSGGATRGSRRRGQHAAGEEGPAFDGLRFASADALLADVTGGEGENGNGSSPNGAATLEESLREVLTPPDAASHMPPVPQPPPPHATNGTKPTGEPSVSDGPAPEGPATDGQSAGSSTKEHHPQNGAAGSQAAAAPAGPLHPPPASANGAHTNGNGAAGPPDAAVRTLKPEPPEDAQPHDEPEPGEEPGTPDQLTSPDGPESSEQDGSQDQPGSQDQDGSQDQPVVAASDAVPPPPPGYGSVVSEAEAETPSVGQAPDVHWPPLARVLVTAGKVSFAEMVQALRVHREAGESLARYLFNHKLATEEDLVQAMAEEVGLEFVDLASYPPDPNVASLIPESVARRHMVLPLRIENGVPIVAMANPTDVFAMDDLRSIMGRNFTAVVATRSQIDLNLRQLQESAGGDVQEAAQSAAGVMGGSGGTDFELESLQSVVEDAPIVRYVNLLILQALNERASDIHIEPTPKRLSIRFRIDGVMHDASSASPAIHASVISRLKVLGEMDITEHRVPQEGRVSVSVGERQIDLRLAIIPSQYGETCVMRLLDKSASIRRLSELGFFPDTLERYAQAYNHPYGVILVTGPTGAGKTTTLYATLQEVMSAEKSVITVEDPVEYQIDGITQVQINQKVGLLFSTALRSILRADPDIILVGEIRDMETASIAMEAALSGHLVLSTLHTNTAAATPLRLTEMGIEPFLVTSAVGGVLTQRLARVLCEKCKTPYDASLTDFYAAGYKEADLEGLDVSTLYRAEGCRTCSHTGYHGRMLLAEVMPITEEIERMIIEQQSIVAMERQAVEQGMRTLRQDGLRKALAGFTTLEEVLRVVV